MTKNINEIQFIAYLGKAETLYFNYLIKESGATEFINKELGDIGPKKHRKHFANMLLRATAGTGQESYATEMVIFYEDDIENLVKLMEGQTVDEDGIDSLKCSFSHMSGKVREDIKERYG